MTLTYCRACHNARCKSPAKIHPVSGDSTVSRKKSGLSCHNRTRPPRMRFCVLGLFGFLQKAGKNLKYCDKHCPVFNNPIRIGIFANLSSEFCL
ncbi:MAG: hypothetical protein KC615_10870, partial [Anaerolineae bacterium]|nr:hypothetical protein [Anaerolineae bacterium]